MITLRPAASRGWADHGWLKSAHSFSFADYLDPAHMGFGNLRVVSEDRIAPGTGFGTHGHCDMEIVSYVLDGALAHRDSRGHAGLVRPGELQYLCAGSGVQHSEFNAAPDAVTHFLQIWLLPMQRALAPGHGRIAVARARTRGRLALLAAPATDGAPASDTLAWHADARLYAGLFDVDEAAVRPLAAGRLGYVHVARGGLEVNGRRLQAGDAAMLSDEAEVVLRGGQGAEVLVFDLAPRA